MQTLQEQINELKETVEILEATLIAIQDVKLNEARTNKE